MRKGKLTSLFSLRRKLGGNSQNAEYSSLKELAYQLLQHLNDEFYFAPSSLIEGGGRAFVTQLTLDHVLCMFSIGAWPFLWNVGEPVTSCLQPLETPKLQSNGKICMQNPVTHAKEFLPVSTCLGHLGGYSNNKGNSEN